MECCLAAGCLEHIARPLQRSEPAPAAGAVQAAGCLLFYRHYIQRALDKNIHTLLGHVLANAEVE